MKASKPIACTAIADEQANLSESIATIVLLAHLILLNLIKQTKVQRDELWYKGMAKYALFL
mgnify:CR=1 FL=1